MRPKRKRLPEPLTEPDLDLRKLPYMPLDIVQLQSSETWAMATGNEAKAMMNLWMKAWHEVPAASLPNNDAVLAAWSGAGPDWPKVRDVALRGFVLCRDGRLYHRVIAVKARQTGAKTGRQMQRNGSGRYQRKSNTSHRTGNRTGHRSGTAPDTGPATGPAGKRREQKYESSAARESIHPRARARGHEAAEPFETNGVNQKPETATAVLSDEAFVLADSFLSLRESFWPDDPNLAAPLTTLETQAAGWLAHGLDVETVSEVVLRKMRAAARDGKAPPNSFKAYELGLRDAAAKVQDPGGEARLEWWQDVPHPEIKPLLDEWVAALDWDDAEGTAARRREIEARIEAKKAEIRARGERAA